MSTMRPLSSIEPVEFADEVSQTVASRAAYAWELTTGTKLDLAKVSSSALLAKDALALAHYAKAGPPVSIAGYSSPQEIERALVTVTSALHVPAFSEHQLADLDAVIAVLGGGSVRMAILLDHPTNLVLAAAWARLRLEQNESVTPVQLAILASLSEDTVRADVRSGDLPSAGKRPAVIPARAAKAWLSARGIAGYTQPVKVVAVGGDWAGLAFSPWHQAWGRITKLYSTRERAENALARAAAFDDPRVVYTWVDDPEGLGWKVPCRRGRTTDRIELE